MTTLTLQEINAFTENLDKISVSIGAMRQKGKLVNGTALTEAQKNELLLCQIRLFRGSARFSAQAINLNAETVRDKLVALSAATRDLDQTLAHISSIDRLISFSTLAIDVTTAVASGDALGVASSLDSLLENIVALKTPVKGA